ncbi:MAG: FHA domain-containing protein [Actinomycetota bacterium]|nr:FHA domain-containing protein [Actinomycetota bacterium]
MSVICSQCRTENPKESQFCSRCGEKLISDLETTITFAEPIEIGEEEKIDLERLAIEGPLLVVIKGIGVGQTFRIGTMDVLIGRDPTNDIFLDDITVSRRHAQIKHGDNGLVILDTGSLNGTYLNRERVEGACLNHGDEIQIGKFKMVFLDKSGAAHDDKE